MNILLLGSGGREHAIAWKLAQSPLLTKLFIAPGNAGTLKLGTNLAVSVNDFSAIAKSVLENHIEMLVVGPEDPLVNGIHDYFLADHRLRHIPVIGPVQKGAMLEGSKDFAKEFMNRHGIPTARHRTFTRATIREGIDFLHTLPAPYVLKADGLAAGKGVIICKSIVEAESEFTQMLQNSKFGQASEKVVIEEFLTGIELSVFVLTDGKSYKLLPEAKDYKKIGEADTGPNTGGMGSVSPVSFANDQFMQKVEQRVILPTIRGLADEGIDYKGFIFFGLINVAGNPFVIEYNCRLGDPETESVLPRLVTDLLDLFQHTANQTLDNINVTFDKQTSATVMMVSAGYPDEYKKGEEVEGDDKVTDSMVFHAGTIVEPVTGKVKTNGGRVMAVTSLADTMQAALEKSYRNIEKISYTGKTYRRDIGFDL